MRADDSAVGEENSTKKGWVNHQGMDILLPPQEPGFFEFTARQPRGT